MEMKTPYYIMKIYDKNNCVVETEEDDDYDYICETFAWRFMNELDRKEGKTGKIFKVTKGKKEEFTENGSKVLRYGTRRENEDTILPATLHGFGWTQNRVERGNFFRYLRPIDEADHAHESRHGHWYARTLQNIQ